MEGGRLTAESPANSCTGTNNPLSVDLMDRRLRPGVRSIFIYGICQ